MNGATQEIGKTAVGAMGIGVQIGQRVMIGMAAKRMNLQKKMSHNGLGREPNQCSARERVGLS